MCGSSRHRSACRWRSTAAVIAAVLSLASSRAYPQTAQPPPPPGADARQTALPPAAEDPDLLALLQRLRRSLRPYNVAAFVTFFAEHNPEELQVLQYKLRTDKEQALVDGRRLVLRFLALEQKRATHPEEYQRLVRIEQLTSRSRKLARQIRAIHESSNEPVKARDPETQNRLGKLNESLAACLDEMFDARQQNQLIEVNRLEAEVREMRRLLEQRQANRQEIIRRQMLELTGALADAGN